MAVDVIEQMAKAIHKVRLHKNVGLTSTWRDYVDEARAAYEALEQTKGKSRYSIDDYDPAAHEPI
ncbi:hypothetical protein HJA85_26975 [Rhizobium bangladeshense]|uniref:Uncharacterized protein n=1 Tax=Rhizobium lentis TaxID=1138194 RepID=A0A9Q3M6P3_9HYPH|nr:MULTISPECIES: hypothetical protein [Rhizobium]MBX4870568.1 hypothetical protein [Rhizobium bangladeshense]MBX4872717.1 hypothetical protein [Rhizobium bangladeshense]MBX5021237.1 hypothetical protein [Rhizobium lentis]MBX5063332.1 hypothetical protein [Rhizobium lentis]MBX5075437.1 hypothetical protein [Rhizobium lentis]